MHKSTLLALLTAAFTSAAPTLNEPAVQERQWLLPAALGAVGGDLIGHASKRQFDSVDERQWLLPAALGAVGGDLIGHAYKRQLAAILGGLGGLAAGDYLGSNSPPRSVDERQWLLPAALGAVGGDLIGHASKRQFDSVDERQWLLPAALGAVGGDLIGHASKRQFVIPALMGLAGGDMVGQLTSGGKRQISEAGKRQLMPALLAGGAGAFFGSEFGKRQLMPALLAGGAGAFLGSDLG